MNYSNFSENSTYALHLSKKRKRNQSRKCFGFFALILLSIFVVFFGFRFYSNKISSLDLLVADLSARLEDTQDQIKTLKKELELIQESIDKIHNDEEKSIIDSLSSMLD